MLDPATTKSLSAAVFVPKRNGGPHFCVNYRRLNASTIRNSYPIPKIDKCIDSLGGAQVFSFLSVNSGYWQIERNKKRVNKTTSVTRHGLFRYVRMPLGLENAPATIQRAKDVILPSVKCQYVIVYSGY